MSFFGELKRRNVFKVTVGYVISSWLLAQVADLVLENIGAPEWVMQTILLVLALGFPIVVFFSWAYEVTPEGVKRESEIDRSQSITHVTGRKLDRAVTFVLAVALCYLVFDKFFLTDTAPQPIADAAPAEEIAPPGDDIASKELGKSIAVLPFVNMSADESSLYFSDGLADTVLHMLAQISEIRVAARTSSFQFRDQTMDIGAIGEQLNVATVLEGSVQRAGDKIRVTAQLIDVSNGYHLWSGNFDRELDDVFAIQDEIASEVVGALKVSILGESEERLQRDQTTNVAAYTEYLLGINELSVISSERLTSAIQHLNAAIELDPEYAAAYAMLGRAYVSLYDWGGIKRSEGIPAARKAASRALDLVPDSTEALAVLGMVEIRDANADEGRALLEKALAESPNNALALEYYAESLFLDGRAEEAIATFRQLISVDPLSELAHMLLAQVLSSIGRYDEASGIIEHYRSVSPESTGIVDIDFYNQYYQGNIANAIVLMRASVENNPDPNDPDPEGQALLGAAYLAIGMPDEASRWYDRAIEVNSEHPVSEAAPLFLSYYRREIDENSMRLAQELLAEGLAERNGSRVIALIVLIEYAIQTGRHDIPLEALDNLYPHLFDEPPTDIDRHWFATFLAGWALMESGDTERGSFLLEQRAAEQEQFADVFGVGLGTVSNSLALRDIELALEQLEKFSSDPYSGLYYKILFERSSLYDPIRNEPLYIEILERYEANSAEQQQLLQEMTL